MLKPSQALASGARVAALVLAALACMATSAPRYHYVRAFPTWTVAPASSQLVGCASLSLWISRSGKTGVGVSLLASTSEPHCQVTVESLSLSLGGARLSTSEMPPPTTLRSDSPVHFYFPIEFDNEGAWNDGHRRGELAVELQSGAARSRIAVIASHARPGNHLKIDRFHGGVAEPDQPPARTIRTITPRAPLELVPEAAR